MSRRPFAARLGLGSLAAQLSINVWPPKEVFVTFRRKERKTSKGKTVPAEEYHVYRAARETVVFFVSKLAINMDGAPNAYAPKDRKDLQPLDNLANAGPEGHEYGVAKDKHGTKYVQSAEKGHPFPGYYVSTTSLQDSRFTPDNPKRYVDSTAINFIVLPKDSRWPKHGTKPSLGDMSTVVYKSEIAHAIFGDIGPPLGEGSIALATALKVPHGRNGGVDAKVVCYVVYPGSGNGKPQTQASIDETAAKLFQAWGGLSRLRYYFPLKSK